MSVSALETGCEIAQIKVPDFSGAMRHAMLGLKDLEHRTFMCNRSRLC